jgi:hypothetical protein
MAKLITMERRSAIMRRRSSISSLLTAAASELIQMNWAERSSKMVAVVQHDLSLRHRIESQKGVRRRLAGVWWAFR